jgi:hypothetical protein
MAVYLIADIKVTDDAWIGGAGFPGVRASFFPSLLSRFVIDRHRQK